MSAFQMLNGPFGVSPGLDSVLIRTVAHKLNFEVTHSTSIVNHAMHLQDFVGFFMQLLISHPRTSENLGRTEERSKQIKSATIDAWRDSLQNPFALVSVLSSQINAADARCKEHEQKAAATRCYAHLAVLRAVGGALTHLWSGLRQSA
jgi:hypothetical protein